MHRLLAAAMICLLCAHAPAAGVGCLHSFLASGLLLLLQC